MPKRFVPSCECCTTEPSFCCFDELSELPEVLCLDHSGTNCRDMYGMSLYYHDVFSDPVDMRVITYAGHSPVGYNCATPPSWIPDIRTQSYYGVWDGDHFDITNFNFGAGSGQSLWLAMYWHNLLGLDAFEAGQPDPVVHSWWSDLFDDFECEEQSLTYRTNVQSGGGQYIYTDNEITVSFTYHSFYVYTARVTEVYTGGWGSNVGVPLCNVSCVQIRRRMQSITSTTYHYGPLGPISISPPVTVTEDLYEFVGIHNALQIVNAGYGDYNRTIGPCNDIQITCDPFEFTSTMWPGEFRPYLYAGAMFPRHLHCSCPVLTLIPSGFPPIGHPCVGLGWGYTPNESYCYTDIELDNAGECTEDRECHWEWYEDYEYDEENDVYVVIMRQRLVCGPGLGTYTHTGPRVRVYICEEGSDQPPTNDNPNGRPSIGLSGSAVVSVVSTAGGTYNETGSGGVGVGSSADAGGGKGGRPVPSGGGVVLRISAPPIGGGCRAGGSALTGSVIDEYGSWLEGVSCGGTSTVSVATSVVIYTDVGTGGLLGGGAGAASKVTPVATSGGVGIGGNAVPVKVFVNVGSGGVGANGLTIVTVEIEEEA